MYTELQKQLKQYYRAMDWVNNGFRDDSLNTKHSAIAQNIIESAEEFYRQNKNLPAVNIKSKFHCIVAENFEPVIFSESPFFYEMGLKESKSWGVEGHSPCSWLKNKLLGNALSSNYLCKYLFEDFYKVYIGYNNSFGVCNINSPFDIDHHSLGYTKLFAVGMNGIKKEAQDMLAKFEKNSDKYYFCEAVIGSIDALISVAKKFSDKAKEMLETCQDEKQRDNLKKIAETALKIPANPPTTFYEGLAMLLFTRETIATLEFIGISQLGHVDKLLADLYYKDIESGRMNEEEAKELIGKWMCYTDIKFDLKNNAWPETSTCIQLGGCDESGKPVFNKVTELVIKVHHELGLINPKLNCRFSKNSPREYLELIGESIVSGHNNFALCNDDIIISGLIKNGVAEKDARRYVNGGCQETMIEGCGHTEGAHLYMSLARILNLFMQPEGSEAFVPPLDHANDFDEFYQKFISSFKTLLSLVAEQRKYCMNYMMDAYVCPLFSSTQAGCIESGKDYVNGGALYNFSTVCVTGMGDVANSLYVIKKLIFEDKIISLPELCSVLNDNWNGHEKLRQTVLSMPKYGQNNEEVNIIANSLVKDLSDVCNKETNQRGGRYILSLFVYYYYTYFAPYVKATPDGRKDYDLLSPGISPARYVKIKDITFPLNTIGSIDFTELKGGNAVLDVQLPLSKNMNKDIFASLISTCGELGCPTIQPNIVSVEELKAAKEKPEEHKDIVVRICGLSAYFVALSPEIQDEIIQRIIYNS